MTEGAEQCHLGSAWPLVQVSSVETLHASLVLILQFDFVRCNVMTDMMLPICAKENSGMRFFFFFHNDLFEGL